MEKTIPLHYSFRKAAVAARLSELAYLPGDRAIEKYADFFGVSKEPFACIENREAVAYVGAPTAEDAFVAFRGTSDVHDLLDDFTALQVRIGDKRAVHRGFYRYTLKLWYYIEQLLHEWVHQWGIKRLLLTGHSLGAAAAVLCAHLIYENDKGLFDLVKDVYLYGCPKVGNKYFVRHYRSILGDRTWQHQNNNDPVCWIPNLCGAYRRVVDKEHLVYYDYAGRVLFRPTFGQLVRDKERGVVACCAQVAWNTVILSSKGMDVSPALSAAIVKQLDEFDHRIENYRELAYRNANIFEEGEQ